MANRNLVQLEMRRNPKRNAGKHDQAGNKQRRQDFREFRKELFELKRKGQS